MELTAKQRRYLKGLAHHLDPVVQVGKAGYTHDLLNEIDRNLRDHELIKIRVAAEDRDEFKSLSEQIATDSKAALVDTIGRIALLYREGDEPEIRLP